MGGMDKMRLARLRNDINVSDEIDVRMGYGQQIAPKGTIVQVHDVTPFFNTYLCSIPGYSRARGIAIYNLEVLDESN